MAKRIVNAASFEKNTWTCELSASQAYVQAGDDVIFTVRLINQGITNSTDRSIDAILSPDQRLEFYKLFNYDYHPGGFTHEIRPSNPAKVFDQQAPKGSYAISVAIKSSNTSNIEQWFR